MSRGFRVRFLNEIKTFFRKNRIITQPLYPWGKNQSKISITDSSVSVKQGKRYSNIKAGRIYSAFTKTVKTVIKFIFEYIPTDKEAVL